MNTLPKISIITVCYNAAPLLAKTLSNISLQDYQNIEVVVIDGASEDNTKEILDKNSSLITKFISEPDKGIYDAMNKGVSLSTGEWVIFINAGDQFARKDILSTIFRKAINADIVYGDVIKPSANGTLIYKKAEPPHNGHRMYFCHQSAFTRTSLLKKYPYDIKYKLSADFKFYKLMWKKGKKFLQLDLPISIFDVTGVSNSRRADGLQENINIIWEIDGWKSRIKLLPRMYFVLLMTRVRNHFRSKC